MRLSLVTLNSRMNSVAAAKNAVPAPSKAIVVFAFGNFVIKLLIVVFIYKFQQDAQWFNVWTTYYPNPDDGTPICLMDWSERFSIL